MSKLDHSKNIIEIQDVSFSYGKDVVLKNISLNIHQGDYLAVVGPNGSGKTTLLKIMLGIVRASSGSAKLFGTELSKFKDWPKIGYVPQKATNFDANFPATVFEVVLMGRFGKRGLLHEIKKEDEEKAMTALSHVGMSEFKNRLIGELSGGQQQRVFIARALASDPEIIILDEPTAGVDEKNQEELYSLLKKLNTEFEITLVLVSHDIERMIKESMHIACIDKTLTCHVSPEDFLKDGHRGHFGPEEVNIIGYHHNNQHGS